MNNLMYLGYLLAPTMMGYFSAPRTMDSAQLLEYATAALMIAAALYVASLLLARMHPFIAQMLGAALIAWFMIGVCIQPTDEGGFSNRCGRSATGVYDTIIAICEDGAPRIVQWFNATIQKNFN
jgi:hypothetical protein